MNTKLILPIALFIFLSTISYAQYSIGVGLLGATSSGFNFEEETEKLAPGAQVKFQYRLNDKFVISPNVGTYLASKSGKLSFSNFEANIDLQFNVVDNQYNRGYILFGPTYNRVDFVLSARVNNSDATIGGGINRYGGFVGFGIEQKSNFYQEFVIQYKDQLIGGQFNNFQVVVKVGYLFNWGEPKETFRNEFEVMTEG